MFFQETARREQEKKAAGKAEKDANLIDQVSECLSKTFVKGAQYGAMRKRIKDLVFLRSTNTLPDSPFIATSGPKNQKDLCRFITDILSCPPQLTIVALGDRLSADSLDENPNADVKRYDFMNYYIRDYTVGPYTIRHRMVDGHFRWRGSVGTPVIFAESKLKFSAPNEAKTVRVIGLQLEDGCAIDLRDDPFSQKKEMLWHLFIRSWQDSILVHCKYGHGRTGHLILTLQVLRHYDEVFSDDDPALIAARVSGLLRAMRQQRPHLVQNLNQLTMAVRNAWILCHYALEQGYILHVPNESAVARAPS